jgi:hypothetical protein
VLGSIIESLSPPLTEHERQILDLVMDGQTDSQIRDLLGSRADQLGTSIEELVARVTKALLGAGSPSGEPGVGKHRRTE